MSVKLNLNSSVGVSTTIPTSSKHLLVAREGREVTLFYDRDLNVRANVN